MTDEGVMGPLPLDEKHRLQLLEDVKAATLIWKEHAFTPLPVNDQVKRPLSSGDPVIVFIVWK